MIVSAGQTWVRLDKEYLHSDWISDADIWMAGGKVGDLSARKMILLLFNFLTKV